MIDGNEAGTEQITISLQNGRRVAFEVQPDRNGKAYFVLGVRKSGSSLLNRITNSLARLNGYTFVNVGTRFFSENINAVDWQFDPALPELIRPGNVYGGFRDMPVALLLSPMFASGAKIFIVRDPRDALVSEYFSNAYSHPLPEITAGAHDMRADIERQRRRALNDGIDTYVLSRAPAMARTINEFSLITKSSTAKLFRYEDIIFRKRELIEAIVRHFDWSVDEESLAKILQRLDIRPAVEDPRAFIRKVTPGDHREKLQPATIEKLNHLLEPVMKLFNYSTESTIDR